MGAVGAAVAGREVAQDAAADLAALGFHADGLGDVEVAVALDLDVADEERDALDRERGGACGDEQQEREGDTGESAHGLPPGNAICGTLPSARFSSSKNGSSLKPRGLATRTAGKDWMAMLRLRAAPL